MEAYRRNAIVCISGGVDSVTTAYYVKKILAPRNMLLILCNYGQRTFEYEKWCSEKVSEHLNVDLKIIDLKWLGEISTSLLTKPEVSIPETKEEELWDQEKAKNRILRWWDPCRNALLLLVALAHAESFDIKAYLDTGERERWDVYIGIRRETPVPMKDNTPEFVQEMNRMAEICTHFGGYRVLAPFINLDKDSVVRIGEKLGVNWMYTYSCYAGAGWTENGLPIHCGVCSNCKRRKLAFRDAGVKDPSIYKG